MKIYTFILRLLPMAIFLSGCISLPDVNNLADKIDYRGNPPRIIDASGPLPAEKAKAIISHLNGNAPTEILGRHLAFVEAISGEPIYAGNKVTLLCDGPETYAAMEKAILNARDHINIETFIFSNDEVGVKMSELLIRRCREGVTVNLIYDSWGAKDTDPEFFARMRGGGINALELNPVDSLGTTTGWNINNRDHRKILVVDGKIAFTGGINFFRGYSGSSMSRSGRHGKNADYFWRDMHVQIEGPAVIEFQKLFLKMWATHGDGYPLAPAKYFPLPGNVGGTLVRVLASSPDQPVPNIYASYKSAILHSKKTVHLTNAYFTPDSDFLDVLAGAAQRGIDVKVILPSFSDFWLPFYAGRSYYSRLLESGVKIYERRDALLHSKTAVIDGVWSTVGSSNLSLRSFMHDAEVNAVILDRKTGEQMEEIFYLDLAQSDEITIQQWKKRPYTERLKELLTKFFRYFL